MIKVHKQKVSREEAIWARGVSLSYKLPKDEQKNLIILTRQSFYDFII